MNVASIMTRKVVTVEMDDPLQTICEVFINFEFHHILVVEDWKLVGVISESDLLRAAKPCNLQELHAKVERIRREQNHLSELSKKSLELEKIKAENEHTLAGLKGC